MKQPISKLPFKCAHGINDFYIEDVDASLIATELYKEDAEYLVHACNSYPTLIDLIERCYNSMRIQSSDLKEELELMDEITDFLNMTEDENME